MAADVAAITKAVAATSNVAFVAARSEVLRYSSRALPRIAFQNQAAHALITAPSSNCGIPAVNFEDLNRGRSPTDVRAKAIARLGIMAG